MQWSSPTLPPRCVHTFTALQAVGVTSVPGCHVVLVSGASFRLQSTVEEPCQHCAWASRWFLCCSLLSGLGFRKPLPGDLHFQPWMPGTGPGRKNLVGEKPEQALKVEVSSQWPPCLKTVTALPFPPSRLVCGEGCQPCHCASLLSPSWPPLNSWTVRLGASKGLLATALSWGPPPGLPYLTPVLSVATGCVLPLTVLQNPIVSLLRMAPE